MEEGWPKRATRTGYLADLALRERCGARTMAATVASAMGQTTAVAYHAAVGAIATGQASPAVKCAEDRYSADRLTCVRFAEWQHPRKRSVRAAAGKRRTPRQDKRTERSPGPLRARGRVNAGEGGHSTAQCALRWWRRSARLSETITRLTVSKRMVQSPLSGCSAR